MLGDGVDPPIWRWARQRPGLVARVLQRDQTPSTIIAVNHTLEPASISVRGQSYSVGPLSGRSVSL
jgi:hypothetical protein